MKTVRVRIAVVVTSNGKWEAAGGSLWNDRHSREMAGESAARESATYFIEADLPVPEAKTVEGRIA